MTSPITPPDGISTKRKLDLIINFIATTPENINYNIVREAITALVTNNITYNFDNLIPKEETLPPSQSGELDEVETGEGPGK